MKRTVFFIIAVLFCSATFSGISADLGALTRPSAEPAVFASQPLVESNQPLGIKRYVPDPVIQAALSERPLWQDFLARHGALTR